MRLSPVWEVSLLMVQFIVFTVTSGFVHLFVALAACPLLHINYMAVKVVNYFNIIPRVTLK